MIIRDPGHILPQEELLRQAITQHPVHPNLGQWLDEICVAVAPSGAQIEHDPNKRSATLGLPRNMPQLPEYEYVLLHEFTHVGDRVDPSFEYRDDEKRALAGQAYFKFVELWNVYIDSRLHHHGKFVLGEHDKDSCMINGKAQIPPYSIEGKLLRHISALSSARMPQAEETVREIWRCPERRITFGELVALAKNGDGQPDATGNG